MKQTLLILSMIALPAMADVPADSLFADIDLSQVVVTGTRTPKLLAKSPVQTTVITRRQIEQTDATDLRSLLEQSVPGVEFSYAMNQMVHMNFSGFGGQSMLVLVDGERLAGETMDDVDFARIAMSNVERVEIVRGAASALYGSNANGGVINIITKKKSKTFGLNVNGRLGRHGSQRYGLTLENGGRHVSNMFSVMRTSMDNYNVSSATDPKPVSRVISTIYGDHTWNFSERLRWTPTDRLQLMGRAGYFFRQMKRNPTAPERYRDYTAGLAGAYDFGPGGKLEANYSFDQYDKSNYQTITSLDVRSYSNVQNAFRLLYTLPVGQGGDMFNAGADYMHDYLYNNKLTGLRRRQDSFDAFAQYDWNVTSRLEAVGALRYDYFSDGHVSRLTPKLSLRYEPAQGLNLRLGYGMGFRAPTLKEKYYDFDMAGIWNVTGNADLKAEVSHNINVSAEYRYKAFDFVVAGHYNKVENKISTGAPYYPSADATMPNLPYINLANYNLCGLDATVQTHWTSGLSARLNYSWIHEELPTDKEGKSMANAYMPARSHSLTAHLDWEHQYHNAFIGEWYDFYIAIDGRFLSSVDNQEFVDYYDVSRGTIEMHYPAYTLWKLSTVHAFGKKKAVKLTLTLDNIFNYKPKYYYLNCPLTDGMSFMAGLSVDIDKLL